MTVVVAVGTVLVASVTVVYAVAKAVDVTDVNSGTIRVVSSEMVLMSVSVVVVNSVMVSVTTVVTG
jgi:hypothetical protein